MEETIKKLKEQAYESWPGKTGTERAEELETYLRKKLANYSAVTGIPEEEILARWEEDRNYSAINYYQNANQPDLNADETHVFESKEDLRKKFGKDKFRCPACGAESEDPYECTDQNCDWKSYGLFGTMGKGIFIFLKDQLRGTHIFMPLSIEPPTITTKAYTTKKKGGKTIGGDYEVEITGQGRKVLPVLELKEKSGIKRIDYTKKIDAWLNTKQGRAWALATAK